MKHAIFLQVSQITFKVFFLTVTGILSLFLCHSQMTYLVKYLNAPRTLVQWLFKLFCQMIQWYFPFMAAWLSWEVCCQISTRNSSVREREKSLSHNVIEPSVFVLTYAEFLWFKHSYRIRSVFDWDATPPCKCIMSAVFCFNYASKVSSLFQIPLRKGKPTDISGDIQIQSRTEFSLKC